MHKRSTADRNPRHQSRPRCKPGDRCVIVAPSVSGIPSPNIGRIVVVIRPYIKGETISGVRDWIPEGKGVIWVVASFGDGLLCYTATDGARDSGLRTTMMAPMADSRLVPLDDDDDRDSTAHDVARPITSELAK